MDCVRCRVTDVLPSVLMSICEPWKHRFNEASVQQRHLGRSVLIEAVSVLCVPCFIVQESCHAENVHKNEFVRNRGIDGTCILPARLSLRALAPLPCLQSHVKFAASVYQDESCWLQVLSFMACQVSSATPSSLDDPEGVLTGFAP